MRFQPPRPKNDDERILPLINVVFLLLIFFMLAGKLAAVDPIAVKPPRSESENPTDARELVIVMSADGRLAFDGAFIEETDLKAAVAGKLRVEPPPRVWLKADSGTESIKAIGIMEILRKAGVERLKLLTVPSRDDGTG
ncbi:MAG: biopolymer transporter ExbD [Alphaproteobacteria bacterium]|nr:biopolymer transporter ExbD [Alphaproteobacteria bacterium]